MDRTSLMSGVLVAALVGAAHGWDVDFQIVPAPGAVVIDGKLADWDTSGAFGPIAMDPEVADTHNATFYGMYDANRLYLAARVRDPHALVNQGEPITAVFWNGSSLTFRFCINPGAGVPPSKDSPDIRWYSLWHSSKDKKDYGLVWKTMRGAKVAATGVQATFRKWTDGKGYDMESAVPWSTLGAYRPKAGDRIGWSMDCIWGNAQGNAFVFKAVALGDMFNYGNTASWGGATFTAGPVKPQPKVKPTTPVKAPERTFAFSYTLPAAGKVSAALYDAQGRMVRTLFCGRKQKAGRQTVDWDGNDDSGKPVPRGTYTWKVLLNNSVKLVYQLSAVNAGKPAYRTPDGTGSWGGVWGNVVSVASDSSGVYLLWAMEEGEGCLVKVSESGAVRWKQHLPGPIFGSQTAVASDGTYVYCISDAGKYGQYTPTRQATLWRALCSNGDYAPFSPKAPYLPVGKPYPISKTPLNLWQLADRGMRCPATVWHAGTRGLAARAGTVYVPLYFENKVLIVDGKAGRVRAEITGIERPQGVAVGPDGAVFVASADRIVKAAGTRVVGPVVRTGLCAPYGVATDATGHLYVSDLGKSMQVKKFTPQGRPVWTAGQRGGRPWQGKLNPGDFLFPMGLAVGKTGRVYVGEDAVPKRVVVLDTAGQYSDQWIGPYYTADFAGVDPGRPEDLYVAAANSLMRFKIDYDKKTWKPDTYAWGILPSYPGAGGIDTPRNLQFGQHNPMIRHIGGRTYLFSVWHNMPILRVEGDRFVPSTVVGGYRMPDPDKGWTYGPDGKPSYAYMWGQPNSKVFVWTDRDGDGLTSKAELAEWPAPEGRAISAYSNGWMDTKGTITFYHDSTGTIYRLPPAGTDARGNLLYDWSKVRLLAKGRFKGSYVYPLATDDGTMYACRIKNGKNKGIGWASTTLEAEVMKLDPDGKVVWRTGTKARGFTKPGQMYRLCWTAGVAKGCVFFTDVNGQERVYTTDGLYVDSLLEDQYRGPSPGPYTLWVEHFGAQVFVHPKTNVTYLMAGSDAVHFWRIDGLDQLERIQGTVVAK